MAMMEHAKGWDTAYEGKAVALLTVGFGLVGLDRWIIGPLFPSIAQDLHLNYQDAGSVIGALGLAWGVAALFLGGLSDRIGRKKVLVPAIVMFSLLSGLTGMAGNLAGLVLIRAVMGVTEGAFCPTSFAATAEASKPSRRGLLQGIQQSTFALFGLAFAPIIATQLLAVTSWRWVFVLVAIPGLITAVLLGITIREPVTVGSSSGHRVQRAPLKDIFRHRNVPLGMLCLFCAMTGIFVLSALIPSYLTDYLKLTRAQMGFVTSAIGFGGFFGQFGLPGLSDLLGRKIMAVVGFAVGAVFLYLFIKTGAHPPLLFALLFGTTISAFGLFALITGPIATEAAPLGLISFAAGIIIGAGEIFGGGVAPYIAGTIAQRYGIQFVPYFALCGLVAGSVVSLFLQETAPRKSRSSLSDLDRLETSGDSVVGS
jgi:predicted MFS family arabinose efflux permease